MDVVRRLLAGLGFGAAMTPISATVATAAPETEAGPDLPVGFGYKINWLAIRTQDTEAVLECLGLDSRRPATWKAGIEAAYLAEWETSGDVFVSPPVDEWTFVVSRALPAPADASDYPARLETGSAFRPLFHKLAEHFVEVQFFGSYHVVDFHAWARARGGLVQRVFSIVDSEVVANQGPQTPEEAELGLLDLGGRLTRDATDFTIAHEEAGGDNRLPDESDTIAIASAWSIDPTELERYAHAVGPGVVGALSLI